MNRTDAVSPPEELKIYCIRAHASQPHILALGTSMGLIVVALPILPVINCPAHCIRFSQFGLQKGSLMGIHPLWDNSALMCADSSSAAVIKRVLNDVQVTVTAGDHGGGLALASDVIEEHNAATGQTVNVGLNRQNSSSGALGPLSLSFSGASPSAKRLSFTRQKSGNQPSAVLTSTLGCCRPLFHPSPSGFYCAVVWPDAMSYIVLKVGFIDGSSQSDSQAKVFQSTPMQPVDRGTGVEFAWLGGEALNVESYVVKVPSYCAGKGGAVTARRNSLFFAAKKESKSIFPPSVLLKTLPLPPSEGNISAKMEKLHFKNQHVSVIVENIVDLKSGFLLHMNYLDESAVQVPSSGPVSVPGSATGPIPSTNSDTTNTTRQKLGTKVSRFYYLIRMESLATVEKAARRAAASAAASKQSTLKGKSRMKASAAPSVADQEQAAAEAPPEGFTLLPVGPVMAAASMVSWDYRGGASCYYCALLMAESSTINVLQLRQVPLSAAPLEGGASWITLNVVASVDVSGWPVPVHLSVTSMLWSTLTEPSEKAPAVLWVASGATVTAISAVGLGAVDQTDASGQVIPDVATASRHVDCMTVTHFDSVSKLFLNANSNRMLWFHYREVSLKIQYTRHLAWFTRLFLVLGVTASCSATRADFFIWPFGFFSPFHFVFFGLFQ